MTIPQTRVCNTLITIFLRNDIAVVAYGSGNMNADLVIRKDEARTCRAAHLIGSTALAAMLIASSSKYA